jgi:hypothetical protein
VCTDLHEFRTSSCFISTRKAELSIEHQMFTTSLAWLTSASREYLCAIYRRPMHGRLSRASSKSLKGSLDWYGSTAHWW